MIHLFNAYQEKKIKWKTYTWNIVQAITKSLWWKHPSKSKVCTPVPAYLSHSNKHRGHFGCSSRVALVTPWQPVLFGGLTEKYDMLLKLCGECSNKDGKPSYPWDGKTHLWECVMNVLVSSIFTHSNSYLTCLSRCSCPLFSTCESYMRLPFYTQLFVMH